MWTEIGFRKYLHFHMFVASLLILAEVIVLVIHYFEFISFYKFKKVMERWALTDTFDATWFLTVKLGPYSQHAS